MPIGYHLISQLQLQVSHYNTSDTYGTDASLWIKPKIMTQHDKWIHIETNSFRAFR
jgi:hypothetical protein